MREIYLRVVMVREGVEYIAGLEMRPDDVMGELKVKLKVRMKAACQGLMAGRWRDCAEAIEKSLITHWAGRAYFIEVGNENDGWVQVYDGKDFNRSVG